MPGRNPMVPTRADVVVIGDSQTYGVGVIGAASYPAVLARISGRSTYAMSLGGYGPVEYAYLVNQALALRPKVVVVGLYLGNDIADAHLSLALEHWKDLRDPTIAYPHVDQTTMGARSRHANRVVAAGELVQDNVRLVGWAAHEVRMRLRLQKALANMYWKEPGAPRYGEGPLATLFTPQFRSQAMDLAAEDVRDGLRVTRWCLQRMRERAGTVNAALVVFVLHTKEYYTIGTSRAGRTRRRRLWRHWPDWRMPSPPRSSARRARSALPRSPISTTTWRPSRSGAASSPPTPTAIPSRTATGSARNRSGAS
jgi:hypothetical protein